LGKEEEAVMKKQRKQFVILAILLVLCVLVWVIVSAVIKKNEKKQESIEEADLESRKLCPVEVEDITELSYYYEDTKLTLTLDGNQWICEGNEEVDIDETSINTMLTALTGLAYTEQIEDAEELSEYGLETPQNTVSIKTTDGEYTFYLGDENSYTGDYYVMVEGDTSVYTVSTNISAYFSYSLEDITAEEEATDTDADAVSTDTDADAE
jgi:Na+-transporting NADH:ubiquinone oxidoreductase subunit NqrC